MHFGSIANQLVENSRDLENFAPLRRMYHPPRVFFVRDNVKKAIIQSNPLITCDKLSQVATMLQAETKGNHW
jgi:hypothetical protein